jgi:hypothetical protein
MKRLVTGLAVIFLAACSAPAPSQDSALVVSSDPELSRRVAALLPDLARRAGLELTAPVRVEWRSKEELEHYLRVKLDEELPPEEAALLTQSYALLGLVPEDLDLRSLMVSVYSEQVAGFYDPDSTTLFIMRGQPEAALQPLLVHELVHAVQDQTADLNSLTAKELGSDRRTAAQAAIEGHATLIMFEYMTEQLQGESVDFSQLPDLSATLRPALEAARGQYPELSSAPVVIQEGLLFPYLEGTGFVQRLWAESGGRPAPFGSYLPLSTEQIMHAQGNGVEAAPVELSLTFGAGARVLFSDVLGELEVGILMEHYLGADGAELARGWGGDRFALGEREDGARFLAWQSVWDSAEARDRFQEALGAQVARFPVRTSLVTSDQGGRPGALLLIGEVSQEEVISAVRGG